MDARGLVLLAVVGSALLATWVLVVVDRLLGRAVGALKVFLRRQASTRALRTTLHHVRPAPPAERQALKEDEFQALQAFLRAELVASLDQSRGHLA